MARGGLPPALRPARPRGPVCGGTFIGRLLVLLPREAVSSSEAAPGCSRICHGPPWVDLGGREGRAWTGASGLRSLSQLSHPCVKLGRCRPPRALHVPTCAAALLLCPHWSLALPQQG